MCIGDFPGPLRKGTIPSQNLPNSNGESTSNMTAVSSPWSTLESNEVRTFTLPAVIEFVAVKTEPVDYDIEVAAPPEPEEPEPMAIIGSEEENIRAVIVETRNASTTVISCSSLPVLISFDCNVLG